jgi:hypothetical protein
VDLFAGEADVGGGWFNVLVGDLEISGAPVLSDLATGLRRLIFLGEAAMASANVEYM